jgi:hypothetical protein
MGAAFLLGGTYSKIRLWQKLHTLKIQKTELYILKVNCVICEFDINKSIFKYTT